MANLGGYDLYAPASGEVLNMISFLDNLDMRVSLYLDSVDVGIPSNPYNETLRILCNILISFLPYLHSP